MRLNALLHTRTFAVLLLAGVFAAAVACGTDRPGSDPTQTPTGGTPTPTAEPATPTPTPAGPETTPTATATPTPTPSPADVQARLDAARAKWEANGLDTYSFNLTWSCYCVDSGATITVRVVNGEVELNGEDPNNRYFTVDELFDYVQRAVDEEDAIVQNVEFERDHGYPTNASIDWNVNALHDEMSFRTTNFKIGLTADLDQLRRSQIAALNQWLDSGLANYSFIFRWNCFCPSEAVARVLITVEGGQITSVVDAESGLPATEVGGLEYMTIQELFNWIQQKLDNNPEYAELEFDSANGHPTRAYFDPIRQAVDEEIGFSIEDFQVLDVHEDLSVEVADARAKWESLGLTDYTFLFNWQCFCIQGFVAPMTITVRDGEVESIVRVSDGQPVDEQFADSFVTVDELFDRIEEAIADNAASINATFDAETGVPYEVFIDYNFMIADEEMGWNASEVTALE